jgi:hypothetical protein
MDMHAITNNVGSVLAMLPRFARPPRPGNSQPPSGSEPVFCPDAVAGGVDIAILRESARRLGVLLPDELGWFGRLVRERLRRALAERATPDWERLHPRLTVEERAEHHVARTARRAALCGGLSAAGAHVGEALTLLTEGLAAPICVPAVAASIAGELFASAKMQIDLVFDLASIYGAAFDVSDTAELAAIFDLALHGGKAIGSAPAGRAPRPSTEDEIFARLGRGLLEDAMFGLVPFVGIPCSAVRTYRATARVGAEARRWIRRHVALRDALRSVVVRTAPALLLEGAWLLATVDGVVTHEELLIVAAVARALACDAASVAARFDASDERRWLEAAAALDLPDRAALLDALVITAGLRGPTKHPERRFLARVGGALGLDIDFAQIDALHRHLEEGPSASNYRSRRWIS